jgi:hypothetical protein
MKVIGGRSLTKKNNNFGAGPRRHPKMTQIGLSRKPTPGEARFLMAMAIRMLEKVRKHGFQHIKNTLSSFKEHPLCRGRRRVKLGTFSQLKK